MGTADLFSDAQVVHQPSSSSHAFWPPQDGNGNVASRAQIVDPADDAQVNNHPGEGRGRGRPRLTGTTSNTLITPYHTPFPVPLPPFYCERSEWSEREAKEQAWISWNSDGQSAF